MFEQLQEALTKYEEQQELIESLRTKLLEKSCELDAAGKEIEELQKKSMVNEKLEQRASHAVALTNINAKLMYRLEQEELKTKKLNNELKELKGNDNPKKLREQNARIKEKNKDLQKANDLLKKQNKEYRIELITQRKELKDALLSRAQLSLTHCFSEDSHELWLVPSKLGVDRGKGKENIIALLHLAPNGVGYLVTVENGEISIDKTVLDKDLPRMPENMYKHAETWLSKVEAQNYALTDADLMAVAGFEDLLEEI